ncbi:NUDIX domain-containing protein [Candidatus Woesearchaeota archaeon]|nr:NUDIX domain-containing protein [Candidatus Woesearchaeota archaeon]
MSRVVIVGKKGNFVREEEFKIALEQGMIRRIIRVFVFNKKGQLFLQKRSQKVRIYPGRWDSSATGHVDPGEDYTKAAKRELEE